MTEESYRYAESMISYDPKTGAFFWKCKRGVSIKKGDMVTAKPNAQGYIRIKLRHSGGMYRFRAHRLAWYIIHGKDPECVDHIDGNPTNNKINNLRACDQTSNRLNSRPSTRNKSGVVGVLYYKGAWRSKLSIKGVRVHWERHTSKRKAIEARLQAEQRHGVLTWNKRNIQDKAMTKKGKKKK